MNKTPQLVLVLSALLFCYGFLLGGQQLVLITAAQEFGMGVLGMGTMVSVMHISSTIAPAAMGILADKIGKKTVLVVFAILFGCGCLLAAFAPWLWVFLGAMLIIGAGYSVCESLTSAVCVDIDAAQGARYINLTQCLLSAGAIIAPIVLSQVENWRLLYIVVGIPLVPTGLLLSRMAFPVAEKAAAEKGAFSVKVLLLSPIFLCFMVAMLMYVGLENGFGYFIEPLYAIKATGASLSAYGISAYWLGMTVSRLIYSLLQYPPRKTVQLSFLAAAILFIALILVPSGGICIALCGIVGFAYGPIWTTIVAGAAERFPNHKASATGLISASCGLAGIFYPVLMGVIVEHWDIRISFLVLVCSAIVGLLLSFPLPRKMH